MIVSAAHLYGLQSFARIVGVGGVVHAQRNRIRIMNAAVVAEGAIAAVSPCVGVSVAAHGQRMIGSTAHLYGLQSFARIGGVGGVAYAHRNRRICIVIVAIVAKPAIFVVSPCVGVSVAAHG